MCPEVKQKLKAECKHTQSQWENTHMHAFNLVFDRLQLLLFIVEFGDAAFEQTRGAIVPNRVLGLSEAMRTWKK
jgi:hypothetical protein